MRCNKNEYYSERDQELKALKKAVDYTKNLNYDKNVCNNPKIKTNILEKQRVA